MMSISPTSGHCRPIVAVVVELGAEHPERRPGAGATGHFARLDAAVLELAQTLGLEPRRGVVGVLEALLAQLDHEQPVLHAGVLGSVRVVLRLAIAPSAAADVERPVQAVDAVAVELVAPHQLEAVWRLDGHRVRCRRHSRHGLEVEAASTATATTSHRHPFTAPAVSPEMM